MRLVVGTKFDAGQGEVNLGILQHPRMPELQQLADQVGERLARPINFAQAHNLAVGATGAGAIEVPGGLWRGDWAAPNVVDAVVKFAREVPLQDLETFLGDPAFAECEREYQEWKVQQPPSEPWLGHVDNPPSSKCDGIGHTKEGFVMYIWPDNVLHWKKLARRLSWRFGRKINHVHAFFLYFHTMHYTPWDNAWARRAGCVSTRDVADAIEQHLSWLGSDFLDRLLILPEFDTWARTYEQDLDQGCLPSTHQRMVVTTPMSVQHLVRYGDEQPNQPVRTPNETLARSVGSPAGRQRQITVLYSCSRDKLSLDDRHIRDWMRLARTLGQRIGRNLNFAHAASIFGWALKLGDLKCAKGQWRGCVYSPAVVEILAEYLATSGGEDLDRLLASRDHRRIANEGKMRLQARR